MSIITEYKDNFYLSQSASSSTSCRVGYYSQKTDILN